ncbi:MAG: hypothetical protein BWX74_00804 [Tenericutes bacterium ADurb.Bin087]|nr:MAG: hypothetical protein BWX74_00804 [Tenericutes bacterium ADurb.Bin087]
MYNKFFPIILAFSTILMSGCNLGAGKKEKVVSYHELYDRFPTKKIFKMPADHTKAHYGYTANYQQGHHSWYYGQYTKQGFVEVPYNDKKQEFTNNEVRLEGALVEGSGATRCWISKYSGQIIIDGKFIANDNSELIIMLRNIIVAEYEIPKNETKYIEVPLTVALKDELYLIVKGSALFNPTIHFKIKDDTPLHYESAVDTNCPHVGDVHPLYVNGQLRNYYLSTNGRLTSDMAISDDLVVFRDTNTRASSTNPPMTEGFATRVFMHEDVFYSYYGAYNRYEYTKSSDGYVFENGVNLDEKFNIIGQFNIDERYIWGRDPYAFFDPDINKYRIVSLNYIKDRTPTSYPEIDLSLYTSINDEPHLISSEAIPLINLGVTNNEPEVPMMIKINKRWYLFACLSGRTHNGVGPLSYWIGDENKKIEQVDWNSKKEHILTGEDLCAAQIAEIRGRYYLYGWIAQDHINSQWGGTINVPQEVYQREDGTLGVCLDEYLKEKLSKGTASNVFFDPYSTTGMFDIDTKILQKGNKNDTFASLTLTSKHKRALIKAKFSNLGNDAVTGVEINNNGSIYQIRYSATSNNIQVTKKGVGIAFSKYETDTESHTELDFVVIAEGSILEAFINGRYALSARIDETLTNFNVGVYTTKNEVQLDEFKVSQLATKNNFQDN